MAVRARARARVRVRVSTAHHPSPAPPPTLLTTALFSIGLSGALPPAVHQTPLTHPGQTLTFLPQVSADPEPAPPELSLALALAVALAVALTPALTLALTLT